MRPGILPPLRYTTGGFALIRPEDDPEAVADALLATDYDKEYCVAADFDPFFAADLMAAGFLLMSTAIDLSEGTEDTNFLLLPKLHLVRSVLFFPDIHIKKSIRPHLSRYELRVDSDFDRILNRCAAVHGEDWLTAPLRDLFRQVRTIYRRPPVRPVSFALYRDGILRAGEFGVVSGKVYTSYSGYHDEPNAGTVQMILMSRWLEKWGFAFLDLGMPLDYKKDLGAQNISPNRFVEIFRAAQGANPRGN